MSYQWLGMRISEEAERRDRETKMLARLPTVFRDVRDALGECVAAYCTAFGDGTAAAAESKDVIRIVARDRTGASWTERPPVDVVLIAEPPSLRVEHCGQTTVVEMGLLPDGEVFYKLGEAFLSLEDLTRVVLDRALFPKLTE